jgi:hypothetical protein
LMICCAASLGVSGSSKRVEAVRYTVSRDETQARHS